MQMEENNKSGVVDFPDNFMDQLLWEECRGEEEKVSLWSSLGLKERVTCARGHLQEVMGGEELLIQLWVPVERGRRRVLSTEEQPYSLNLFSQSQSHSQSLALYRDISAGYSFAAEVGSDQLVGLPGGVFLNRMPEWTPDVRFFRSEEYLRIGYAHSLEYGSQLQTIRHALQPHTDDLHREVASILKGICISYGHPLAITWGHQQDSCLSAIVSDQNSRSFLDACSEHHLLAKEGIAGRAFATKKQYFAKDVAILSHYAKMFDLHAALAIPLLTRCSRNVQFVIEFFFPRDYCLINQRPRIATQLSLRFQSSPHLMVDDDQLAEEVTASEQLVAECMSRKGKGKDVSVSWEMREPSFSSSSSSYLESRKRKRRDEKDITLDILRQHFAGSLKDAAKNIGVCPTTLKRICRQHGISRWPSRKIKKVGHSLRKLQVVMDSVEGVQGSHHLASFYSSFPQLQSPLQLDPTKSVAKSPPPSSSSSSSGSSTCCSSEEKQLGGGFHKPSSQVLLTLSSSLMKDEQRPVRATSSLPPLPSARKAKDDGMKVNAMFGDAKMRMRLKHHWGMADLRREIAKGFGMDGDALTSNFSLKYMDDDEEWVLLTCDADLEECIQIYKSSLYKETVRISVSSLL
ncbi:hypothetical protein F2Q69_00058075 [Brassica cretica]|uniref:PB1 domain-containing protein n=1 Tax=Brassica cretica TaxID=69181 RepID=A0A8S9MXL4_BRACR|nr:hypothetical protein F2Q69_00058075 [Brassica cretica]